MRALSSPLCLVLFVAACGGAVTDLPGSDPSASVEDGGHDAIPPAPGKPDAEPRADSAPVPKPAPVPTSVDAGPMCVAPAPPGNKDEECFALHCPAGTICAQRDLDVTSISTCVTIPPQCAATPTCACMGTEAKACALPPDGNVSLGCMDVTVEGVSFLDFPCGCE